MNPIQPVFRTSGPFHHFFGYYDKSPLDITGTKLLSLRVNFNDRLPEKNDFATIGFWEIKTGEFVPLGKTGAFNWQQGCRLQWLGPDFKRKIIFNDRRGEDFVSVILDIETGGTRIIPFPIYSLHPEGNPAVSVDFERLYFPRRSYSYAGIENPEKDRRVYEKDGVFLVDLVAGTWKRIVSIGDLLGKNRLSSMQDAVHYLEHLMFSPSGERFLFLHRWNLADGGVFTRLYSSDIFGNDIRLVNSGGKVTHFTWKNDREITCWGSSNSGLSMLRNYKSIVNYLLSPLAPIYRKFAKRFPGMRRQIAGLSFLNLEDRENSPVSRLGSEILNADGHPSWNPSFPNLMVLDTYPDEINPPHLYLYNYFKNEKVDLGSFHQPPEFLNSPLRCDLHPKWDFSGNLVSIDSLHEGTRQMYLFDISRHVG